MIGAGNTLEVVVYYEDTDCGGVVYHANYLKFMERGRTEWLRHLGFGQRQLAADDDVLFALTRSDVRYVLPAQLDDVLKVETDVQHAKGARMHFVQRIFRQVEGVAPQLLVEADIYLACMGQAGRAKRIPAKILHKMHEMMTNMSSGSDDEHNGT